MKKLLFLLTLGLFTGTASAALTRLPEEFTVVERFFSLTSTFDVNTELEPFAVARKRFFSFTATFDLEDVQGQLLASARARFFSWGTVADVVDPQGQKIGWIEEDLFGSSPWGEYRVFNADNRIAAIARMNFWGTYFEVANPDRPDQVYATVSRPFFRCFRDYWTVQIRNYEVFEEKFIDPRLLVILAIYQTDKDNRDRLRREIDEQLRHEIDYYEGRRLGFVYPPTPFIEPFMVVYTEIV